MARLVTRSDRRSPPLFYSNRKRIMNLIKIENVPDLSSYEQESIDLSYEYWTPEKEGEARRMFYMGMQVMTVPDHNDSGKMVELECAVFAEANGDDIRTVVNASVRLKSIVEQLSVQQPVQITYRGKKKNRSNGNMSDQWSVVTLKKGGGK